MAAGLPSSCFYPIRRPLSWQMSPNASCSTYRVKTCLIIKPSAPGCGPSANRHWQDNPSADPSGWIIHRPARQVLNKARPDQLPHARVKSLFSLPDSVSTNTLARPNKTLLLHNPFQAVSYLFALDTISFFSFQSMSLVLFLSQKKEKLSRLCSNQRHRRTCRLKGIAFSN